MKAILVVDIPDDVEIEDCEIEYSVKEQVMLMQVAKGKTKLKPMPQKKWVAEGFDRIMENNKEHLMSLGWNDCLEELEK